MPDQKNLILAIVLSLMILLAFNFLFEGPRIREQQAQQAEQQQPDGEAAPDLPAAGPGLTGDAPRQAETRAAALATGPRVTIDTPRLHGSLSLFGGRIDDLTLADYRETVEPDSAEIVLLSPREAPRPYYAYFGWVADGAAVSTPGPDTEWTANVDALTVDTPVTLTWDNGQGLLFSREISVDEDYMFTIAQRVTNRGRDGVTLAPYGRVLRVGTPDTLGFFILHEGPYGVLDGTLKEYDYDDLRDDGEINQQSTGGWLGFTDKYWLVALIPDQTGAADSQFAYRQDGDDDRYFATYQSDTVALAPGASVTYTSRLFAGAKVVQMIDGYQDSIGIDKFDRAIDWGWLYFLTKPIFFGLTYINDVVGNFGVAILVLTVFIKLLLFPLANKSYRSMSKMKALQPQMLELRERFSDDRQRLNMEMMQLYKQQKVNPASGCLPILVQIPVFFALYKVLFVTIEMRHAPFFGWIQDLSAQDPTTVFNLFGLIPFTPPDILMIGVWPLLMGFTMWLQQKLNPPPTDPMQQKIFAALPIVFTFMLARFPAGLVIYWAWNNTLSITQQWVIMRSLGVKIGGGVVKPAAPKAAATGQTAAAGATGEKSDGKGDGKGDGKQAGDGPADAGGAEEIMANPSVSVDGAESDAAAKPAEKASPKATGRKASGRRSRSRGGARRRG